MTASAPTYVFGAGEVERERLRLVDETFSPSSATLLERVPGPAPALAYDLGCARGATTRLVSGRTGAEMTVGLDFADEHLDEACEGADSHVRFLLHDVTSTPFPAGPANLIYARFVLAHLPDPAAVGRRWASQLTTGGHLVIDEIEWIDTAQPALAEHLRIVHGLIAAGGSEMHAGPALRRLGENPSLHTCHEDVAELAVPTSLAARMFARSIEISGELAIAAGLIDAPGLRDLRGVLGELCSSEAVGEITWGLHQAIHRRDA